MNRGLSRTLALAVALGCGAPEDPDRIYEEDFETACDGTPCGWTQGLEGDVFYVETLPGDHGLAFEDGAFARGPEAPALPVPRVAAAVTARVNARCDLGAALRIRVSVDEGDRGAVVTFAGDVVPEPTFSRVIPEVRLRPRSGDGLTWRLTRVRGVAIRQDGPGRCEIDWLAIRALTVSTDP